MAYKPSHPISTGGSVAIGRFVTRGWERRLRAGEDVAPRTREVTGVPPGPLRGLPLELAGRGTGERREIAVLMPQGCQVPGSADRDLKIVAVERRETFPRPLFPKVGKQAAAPTKARTR